MTCTRSTWIRSRAQPGAIRGWSSYRSESLGAVVAEVAREWRADLLQVEFTQMAAYRECAPGVPAVLVEHDLTFSLYRQLAQHEPGKSARDEYQRWLAFERRWLRDYDSVWAVSDADREAAVAEGGRAPSRTYTIPNGVDTDRYRPARERTAAAEVLFVGSFRHLPNLIGFDKMAHDVMPLVWQRLPEARLRVVAGLCHERFSRTTSPARTAAARSTGGSTCTVSWRTCARVREGIGRGGAAGGIGGNEHQGARSNGVRETDRYDSSGLLRSGAAERGGGSDPRDMAQIRGGGGGTARESRITGGTGRTGARMRRTTFLVGEQRRARLRELPRADRTNRKGPDRDR